MKNKLILISFIVVIAAAVAFLYLPKAQPTTEVTITSTETPVTTPEKETPVAQNEASNTETTTIAPKEETQAPTPTTQTPAVTPKPETPAANPPVPAAPVETNTYTNGTYSNTVSYKVPEGATESITISLTLVNDKVTDMTFSGVTNKRESEKYQDRFSNSVRSLVIGQPIDSIDLSRVGGASLTTNAFNKAVNAIQQQA